MSNESLYTRLGGYDAIAAVTNAVYLHLKSDDKLRRFYDHRGDDGVGGEFVIKRQLGCEITHRNDVAKRNVRA